MVIVQIATKNLKPTENIDKNDLRPHEANTQDVTYVTAYLKADVLPSTFVIGDGKEYNSGKEKYVNQPLKQNSSYVVFLRFFESKVGLRFIYVYLWTRLPIRLPSHRASFSLYKLS